MSTIEERLADIVAMVAEMKWADRALCADADRDTFFPEKGASSAPAKRICMACPVRAECAEWGVSHVEAYGIWGGLSERERRKVRRERRRDQAA